MRRSSYVALLAGCLLSGCVGTPKDLRDGEPLKEVATVPGNYRIVAACLMDELENEDRFGYHYRFLDREDLRRANVIGYVLGRAPSTELVTQATDGGVRVSIRHREFAASQFPDQIQKVLPRCSKL